MLWHSYRIVTTSYHITVIDIDSFVNLQESSNVVSLKFPS